MDHRRRANAAIDGTLWYIVFILIVHIRVRTCFITSHSHNKFSAEIRVDADLVLLPIDEGLAARVGRAAADAGARRQGPTRFRQLLERVPIIGTYGMFSVTLLSPPPSM